MSPARPTGTMVARWPAPSSTPRAPRGALRRDCRGRRWSRSSRSRGASSAPTHLGLVTVLVLGGVPIQVGAGDRVRHRARDALHAQPPVGLRRATRATRSTSAARACATCSPRRSPTRAPPIGGRRAARTLLGIPELARLLPGRGVMACVSFVLLHLWVFRAAPERRRVSRPLVSVVVPCLNEEDNVGPLYERLRATLVAAEVDYEVIFSLDPCSDATEDRIREIRLLDPRGEDAPAVAALRPAGGDAGGHPHGLGRRVRGHRLRPPGPARADRRDDRALVPGLRRRLRAAALARRRDPAQADGRGARLPGHPPRGRGRDPARTPATSAS